MEISDHERTIQSLRQSEQRFRTLMEASAQIVLVCDRLGRPSEPSPSWNAFTGIPLNAAEDWSWPLAVHEDDRPAVAEQWRDALEHGQPFNAEFRLHHATGLYRYMAARAVPVKSPEGEIIEWASAFTDITLAKRAESARNNLLAIVEGSNDPIVGYSLDGNVISWNRAAERAYGYRAGEMMGRNQNVLIPQEFLVKEQEVLAAIQRGEPVDHFESKRVTKDGRVIDVDLTVSPVYDPFGTLVGVSKIAHDITHRKASVSALKALSEQLAAANRDLEAKVQERTARLEKALSEMEAFSYSITHDLRAPLRAIRGYISLLLRDASPQLPERSRDYLIRITEAAERMDHLIVDALDFSKAMHEHLPISAVDADDLIRRMIEFDPAFHPPEAEVVVEGKIPLVLANQAALTQCFSNLLSNAIKFVAPGTLPKVRIQSERHEGYVRIWVVDNGIGILKEHQERIWGMFQVIRKGEAGTGSGLALVRKVVERMGGRTGVESEPGQGSRFWVELPPAP